MKPITKLTMALITAAAMIVPSTEIYAATQYNGHRGGSSANSSQNTPGNRNSSSSNRPSNNRNNGNSGSNRNSSSSNRPSNDRNHNNHGNSGSNRPSNDRNHNNHGGGNHNNHGNSGSNRPNNDRDHNNHGGGNHNNHNNRPNNDRDHNNHGGGNHNNRPNNDRNHNNHGHGHGHGNPGGHHASRPGNPARPTPPPSRPYRPSHCHHHHHRPVPPAHYHPCPTAPIISSIFGLPFGVSINVSLGTLRNGGYYIDGYGSDVVYLRNVSQMGFYWDDAVINYDNRGLATITLYDSTYGYNTTRYNSLYNDICMQYGLPAYNTYGGETTAIWYDRYGNNYISLSYKYMSAFGGGYRYYTILSYGY
ncbi:MAG: hypothetical protein ACI30Y_00955 [Candidatus Limisoma sp.]